MNLMNPASNTIATHPCPLSVEWWQPDSDSAALPTDEAAQKALDELTQLYANGIPLLRLPEASDDLEAISGIAASIAAHSDHLVLVGIGGSSLGAEALSSLAPNNDGIALHIMDNPDPDSFAFYQEMLDPERTSWLFISKSGGTLEPVTQAMLVLSWLETQIGKDAIARSCHVISEPGDSALNKLAAHYNISHYDHLSDLGGRWSCLSNVGLLPAACAGLDVGAFRQGTNAMLQHTLSAEMAGNQPLQGAIFNVGQLSQNRPIHAIMPYNDRLAATASWCRQLISESIGKDGKGVTPLAALGTVDQHSMLQLMLDGPDDKYFTVLTAQHKGEGLPIPADLARIAGLDYLAGQPLGNVFEAFQQGTIGSLQAAGRPLRTIHLPQVDAFHLGALLMYFMLETVLIASLIGVNAFDQPAVEDSKNRAKHILKHG